MKKFIICCQVIGYGVFQFSACTVPSVLAAPVGANASPALSICSGEIVTLRSVASRGNGAYSYSWNYGNFSAGTITVAPTDSTTYTLIAIDRNNNSSAPNFVSAFNVPPLYAIAAPGAQICDGAQVNLTASGAGGSRTYTCNWLPGKITGPAVTLQPPATITYAVVVSELCSTDTAFIPVTVLSLPQPEMNISSAQDHAAGYFWEETCVHRSCHIG